MAVWLATSSVLHLSSIAYDRYVAICQPLRHAERASRGRTAVMPLGRWFVVMHHNAPIVMGLMTPDIEDAVASASCPDKCVVHMNANFAVSDALYCFVATMSVMGVARRQARSVHGAATSKSWDPRRPVGQARYSGRR
ncbi:unnamed protein product [Lampetra planeri]